MVPEKRWESDSESDIGITAPLNETPKPWFPPPPTASEMKRARPLQRAKPLEEMPPLPNLADMPPPAPVAFPPASKPRLGRTLTRAKSKRMTLFQVIDGWWDLGLLDKRKTMFAQPVPRK